MDARSHLTCQQLIDFIMSYLDDELPVAQRTEFDRHMSACPSCVDYLKTYEKTVALARTCSSEAVPEDIPESLVQAILEAKKRT